jgi:hypothetical protein
MPDRTGLLFFKCEQANFPFMEILDDLEARGLSLEFPGTSFVKVVNSVGESIDWPREWFVRLLQTAPKVNFQWWWSDAEDMCSVVEFRYPHTVFTISLNGQDEVLVDFMKGFYCRLADRGIALGLVLDRDESTLMYPWIDILCGAVEMPTLFPSQMIVPIEAGLRFDRFRPCYVERTVEGRSIAYRRAN